MAAQCWSLKDIAQYLDVHLMTAYKLARAGTLPVAKVKGQYRADPDDVKAWLSRKVAARMRRRQGAR